MKEYDFDSIKKTDNLLLLVQDVLGDSPDSDHTFKYLPNFYEKILKLKEKGKLQNTTILFLGKKKYLQIGEMSLEKNNFKNLPKASLYLPSYEKYQTYTYPRQERYRFNLLNSEFFIEFYVFADTVEHTKEKMEYILKNCLEKNIFTNLKNANKTIQYRIKKANYIHIINKNLGIELPEKENSLSNKKIKELKEITNRAETDYLMLFETLRLLLLENIAFFHTKKDYQKEKEQFTTIIKNESFIKQKGNVKLPTNGRFLTFSFMSLMNKYTSNKFQYFYFKNFGVKGYPASKQNLEPNKKSPKITIEDIFTYLFLNYEYGYKVEVNGVKSVYLEKKKEKVMPILEKSSYTEDLKRYYAAFQKSLPEYQKIKNYTQRMQIKKKEDKEKEFIEYLEKNIPGIEEWDSF